LQPDNREKDDLIGDDSIEERLPAWTQECKYIGEIERRSL
jgi:hypothetical protein